MEQLHIEAGLEQYLDGIQSKGSDRAAIRRCLTAFPANVRSRGLFFEGVLAVLKQRKGEAFARDVLKRSGIGYRITHFGFLPHSDFYRLYFATALAVYPHLPLGRGLERIAEDFYPAMFSQSLAGKTLSLLLTKNPVTVMSRLIEAYGIAVEGNEHTFVPSQKGEHRWSCVVEPSDFYPETFQGIARGMLRTAADVEPSVRVVSFERRGSLHAYEFAISFL